MTRSWYGLLLLLLLSVLDQHAVAATKASDQPVALQADNFAYDKENDIFTAQGRVTLEQDNQMVFADALTYDRLHDTLIADGHVIIVDNTGQTVFAEHVNLHQQFKTGTVKRIGVLFSDGSRAASRYGEQQQDQGTVLHDAVYSPCNLCSDNPDQAPLWQLRANKVVHESATKDIYYHHAKLDVYGRPVAYIPYFSHPDPSVISRSGLLTPRFSSDSKKGFMLRNYYYQAIDPQQDATIEVTTTENLGNVLGGEWRQHYQNANLFFSGSINRSAVIGGSNDNELIRPEQLRGHFNGVGTVSLTPEWRTSFNIKRTTDRLYLRDFEYGQEDILNNTIYAENFSGRNYGVINAYYFQDLRPDIVSSQPDILPFAKYRAYGNANQFLGGRWHFDGQTVSLFRNGQQSISKLSTMPSWERRDILPIGVQSTTAGKIRGDMYWIRQQSPFDTLVDVSDTPNIDTTAARVLPSLQETVSYPLVRPTGDVDFVIEPKAALTLIPNAINNRIPNEDSRDVEVNISNLFDDSRFAGTDRVEQGSHVAYGVKFGGYHQNGNSAFATLGQSFRFANDNPFPNGSGLEDDRSDLVGQIETTLYNHLYTDYRFQMNEQDLSSRKHELQAALLDDGYELRTHYIFAQEVAGTGIGSNRQQLGFSGAKALTKQWTIGGDILEDLSDQSGLLRSGAGLQYKNECLRVSLRGERDLTSRSTGGSDSRVLFTLGLRNLGGYDTPLLMDDPLYRPFGTERKL